MGQGHVLLALLPLPVEWEVIAGRLVTAGEPGLIQARVVTPEQHFPKFVPLNIDSTEPEKD